MTNNFNNPWQNNNFFNKFNNNSNNNKKNIYNIDFIKKTNIVYIILILLFFWLLSGIHKIDTNQQGIVLYFGKFYKTIDPGLNYVLPYPIGKLYKVPVTNINKEEFGFRNSGKITNMDNESLMLTGDENIVDIDFEIQWRIKSATDYLFNVYNPTLTIRMATESAMREVIGKRKIDDALATKKSEIEIEVKDLLQNILDNYETGIEIILVQLLRVDPPVEVISAFRDVQTAKADKERKINEAETYRNDVIPKTRGEVESIIKNAEGYKETLIKNTEGEIAYYNSIYREYIKNPTLTKKRIYLETMESVMNNVDKVIINDKIGQNVLQHLSINKSGN